MKRCLQILFFVMLACCAISSNNFAQNGFFNALDRIELRIDTAVFSSKNHLIKMQEENRLSFFFRENSPRTEIRIFPKNKDQRPDQLLLVKSQDFEVIDSLVWTNDEFYRVLLRFNDLAATSLLSLQFKWVKGNRTTNYHLPLQPYTNTYAKVYAGDADLFIGEEKEYEIVTNRPYNIVVDPKWKSANDFDYRIFRRDDRIFLSIIPSSAGDLKVSIPLKVFQPFITEENDWGFQLPDLNFQVTVKGSRLSFLRIDEREVIWDKNNPEGQEIQIDNHRLLQMAKTYRLENSDERGGPLIAELHTIRRLSNDKVLCMFRPYNYHRISDGFLFIKDGDEAKFITNINILPESRISKVSMLRKGGGWMDTRQIFPGETVEIRLQGESLNRANFIFEGLKDVSADTILRNDNVAHYLITVPKDIRKKSIAIYNGDRKTGVNLDVQEYRRPRELDFVLIDYGGKTPVVASQVTQPILHRGTIGDVTISFDDYYIDDETELFGKQYIEIEVKLKGYNNNLIERYTIEDIEVCPGKSSPRYFAYGDGCTNAPVSINDFLSNKTHSLDHWSKIELIVRHRRNSYESSGYSHRIEIIKEKLVTFDVDLTIPAGLLVKKVGVEGFPALTGISLSMLAQFSFYQRGEIQRLRPYKLGAGFLAQNAFNFNQDAERDLGIVILGSVYPTRKAAKFSFPLFAGFGYFLNDERFFYLIGPGIRISL